jgi:hypothetical protein
VIARTSAVVPFAGGLAQPGASSEQRLDDLGIAGAHGKQERREPQLAAALGVNVGTRLQQRADRVEMTLAGRPHQRRLPAPLFLDVDVGSAIDEERQHFRIAGARRGHQHRLAFFAGRVHVSARFEQCFDDG